MEASPSPPDTKERNQRGNSIVELFSAQMGCQCLLRSSAQTNGIRLSSLCLSSCLSVTFMEVYQDRVRDLLSTTGNGTETLRVRALPCAACWYVYSLMSHHVFPPWTKGFFALHALHVTAHSLHLRAHVYSFASACLCLGKRDRDRWGLRALMSVPEELAE